MNYSIFAQIIRLVFSTILFLCALFIGVMIFGSIYSNLKIHAHSKQQKADQATLFENPEAVRLKAENSEECAPKDVEYYWICGALIKAKPTLPYGYCSTRERPLYYGALAGENPIPPIGDLRFGHPIEFGETSITPAYGPNFQRSRVPSVDTLSENLMFPDGTGQNASTWSARYGATWVRYRDIPVLVSRGSRDWSLTLEETAKVPASIHFKHPDYPLYLSGFVPIDELDNWPDYVDRFIQDGSASVVAFETPADCRRPPAYVKYRFHENGRRIEALIEWNNTYQSIDSPE